jgi:carbonic anhydrase/acetyltransferase-like protein (isoleucine patch superfamily)
MPLYSFEGKTPQVHPSAFIAPTAVLIGDVTVEADASVWYNAVVRSDFSPIVIRAGANVQDNAVLHVTPVNPTEVGAGATVGHLCMIHGATLGEECLIGNGATILDGARIGARSMVAAGALVTPGTEIPEGVLAIGTPAKVRGPLAGTPAEWWVRANPAGYQALAKRHKDGVQPAP